jgi:hypothetical protein
VGRNRLSGAGEVFSVQKFSTVPKNWKKKIRMHAEVSNEDEPEENSSENVLKD